MGSTTTTDLTPSTPDHSRTRRASAAALILLLAMALLAHASPASAATWSQTGNPGVISSTKVYGQWVEKCDLTPSNVLDVSCAFRALATSPVTINRSTSSTGTQLVRSTYWYRRWTGSTWTAWAPAQTPSYWQNTIPAGYSGVTITAMEQIVPAGWFQAALSITWLDAATNRQLGTKTVTFTSTGDYVCQQNIPCQASSSIYLG